MIGVAKPCTVWQLKYNFRLQERQTFNLVAEAYSVLELVLISTFDKTTTLDLKTRAHTFLLSLHSTD